MRKSRMLYVGRWTFVFGMQSLRRLYFRSFMYPCIYCITKSNRNLFVYPSRVQAYTGKRSQQLEAPSFLQSACRWKCNEIPSCSHLSIPEQKGTADNRNKLAGNVHAFININTTGRATERSRGIVRPREERRPGLSSDLHPSAAPFHLSRLRTLEQLELPSGLIDTTHRRPGGGASQTT